MGVCVCMQYVCMCVSVYIVYVIFVSITRMFYTLHFMYMNCFIIYYYIWSLVILYSWLLNSFQETTNSVVCSLKYLSWIFLCQPQDINPDCPAYSVFVILQIINRKNKDYTLSLQMVTDIICYCFISTEYNLCESFSKVIFK